MIIKQNLITFILWKHKKWIDFQYKYNAHHITTCIFNQSFNEYKSTQFIFFSYSSKSIANVVYTIIDKSAVISITQQIFMLGGEYNSHESRKAFTISLADYKLRKLPNMRIPKCQHALAYASSNIYIATGTVDKEATNTCEKYDILHRKYTIITNSKHCRLGASCCSINNVIYLIGGKNTKGNVYSIEKLYSKACSMGWTELAIKNIQNILPSINSVAISIGSGHIFIISAINSFVIDTGFDTAYKCKRIVTRAVKHEYEKDLSPATCTVDLFLNSLNHPINLFTELCKNVFFVIDDEQICKYSIIQKDQK